MIKKIDIEIDGIDYTLPDNITVSHYGEIMRRMSLSDSMVDKAHDIIGVLLNIPYTILRELDPVEMAELSIYLQNKVSSQDVGYIPSFTYKDVNYFTSNEDSDLRIKISSLIRFISTNKVPLYTPRMRRC